MGSNAWKLLFEGTELWEPLQVVNNKAYIKPYPRVVVRLAEAGDVETVGVSVTVVGAHIAVEPEEFRFCDYFTPISAKDQRKPRIEWKDAEGVWRPAAPSDAERKHLANAILRFISLWSAL